MMKLGYLLPAAAFSLSSILAAQGSRPGEPVDLAPFGHAKTWDDNPGVEWDEPRDVQSVEVDFANQVPSPDVIRVEYWVASWPQHDRGGWTETDSTWQGHWRPVSAKPTVEDRRTIFKFAPLLEAENPNAKNVPGFSPFFRRTLKLRLNTSGKTISFSALRVFGRSRWAVRAIRIENGGEAQQPGEISTSIYNGQILESKPVLESEAHGLQLKLLYAEHEPNSNDRTVLTVHSGTNAFGVSIDDVVRDKGIYVKPAGIFIGDGDLGETFASWQRSGRMRPDQDIISRISRQPEQTLTKARAEIPALSLTARSSHPHHPNRYIPLGFTGSREKYGLDAVGSAFISKHGAKAMKEDLARMLWEDDQIDFRLATGAGADFREREGIASQSVLEGYLPFVTTVWRTDGISYEEQAYATMLNAPLDEARLRGDEPSLLLLKLSARNPGAKPVEALAWLQIDPAESWELKDGFIVGTGNKTSAYSRPRLRAALESQEGDLQLRDLPVSSPYSGRAALWRVSVPAGATKVLYLKIPFRTMESSADLEAVRQAKFDGRLDETVAYWKKILNSGMRLNVPDPEFNTFFLSALQHILLSIERDVSSGLYICPCATYDYNEFANETMMQARLLDMRGLHDIAWKCVQPFVDLQGSHPFPGHFKDGSATFHGVRVDADHDYTHSGYNLNHGWVLWTMAEHYEFTHDKDWLGSVLPRMLKAANWIIDERHSTMQREADGSPVPEYGLLPAGQLEDTEEWQYWFAVNAYAYRGLNAAAQAISALNPSEGDRLKKEAAAYREDIRQAALRAMALAPVVTLRDGTAVPIVPPRVPFHGRDHGWIRNVLYGTQTLVDCGVFNTDEPIATWILQDYEDNLFMAEDSLSIPDRDWFSRGGVALQPNLVNTFESYLQRDQLPQALRALYNTFAISYYPDVNAFTEWVPTLGIGGGPFYKTSDEAAFVTHLRQLLIREAGDRLYLNAGSPRNWYLPGRTIEVEHAATFFGEVSYRVDAHPDQGFVEASVSLPQRARLRVVELRLRHPEGKKIVRVQLNNRDWKQFDAQRETITLPSDEQRTKVLAFYQ